MNDELYGYLEAHDHDDWPGGAWQSCIEQSVVGWNKMNGTSLDPRETWMTYVKEKVRRQVAMTKLKRRAKH